MGLRVVRVLRDGHLGRLEHPGDVPRSMEGHAEQEMAHGVEVDPADHLLIPVRYHDPVDGFRRQVGGTEPAIRTRNQIVNELLEKQLRRIERLPHRSRRVTNAPPGLTLEQNDGHMVNRFGTRAGP
jgi:hypothetical protein